MFKFKKACVLLSLLLLSACTTAPSIPDVALPQAIPQLKAQAITPNASQQDLAKLLKHIYKTRFADDKNPTQLLDEINKALEAEGTSIYQVLNTRPDVRKVAYPVGDQIVMSEFNKPSPADNVPPISATEVAQLLQKMKPGDVILCGNNKSFVHAALYVGNGQLIHSLATQPDNPQRFVGVVREPLQTYVKRSERDTFVVLRYSQLTAADAQKATDYANRQLGKGYDTLFLIEQEDRFYCTELVFRAIRHMNRPPRVLPHNEKYGWQMVSVEDFMDSPDFQTVWTRNYTRPPVGRLHTY